MKQRIFELIAMNPVAVSGAAIGKELGVSRVAINKHVQSLIARGINIECSPNVGYRYIVGDTLDEITLSARLKSFGISVKVVEADSTNTWAKANCNNNEDCLVVAPIQFDGKGRMGRKFASDVGGVYMTFVKIFDNLMITDSLNIVLLTGLAVARVLIKYGQNARIKWPNDVYINKKKISGILLESSCSEGKIDRLYLGIGININNKIDETLNKIAVNLIDLLGGKAINREDIIVNVLAELNILISNYLANGQSTFVKEYLDLSMTVGREVDIVDAFNNRVNGRAIGISKLGYLTVNVDGITRDVIAGDVFPKEC